ALIPFAAAPEGVADAAELVRRFERLLHLTGGVGEHFGVRARCGAMHEPRVAEQVRRAPQQLDSSALLLFLEDFHDRVEILVALGQRLPLGRHVAIVEGVERRSKLLDELKRHASAVLCVLYGVAAALPWPLRRAGAERIGTRSAEGVPVNDAE